MHLMKPLKLIYETIRQKKNITKSINVQFIYTILDVTNKQGGSQSLLY